MQKVKDYSKVILNEYDVLLRSINIKRPGLIQMANMVSEETKALAEEWKIVIEAIGDKVHPFKIGDIVMDIKGNRLSSRSTNSKDEYADRLTVIHVNNIEYAVTPDNYEITEA